MKKIVLFAAFAMLMASCNQQIKTFEPADLTLSIEALGQADMPLIVEIDGVGEEIQIPETGVVEIKRSASKAQYANFMYGSKYYNIYLAGSEPIKVKFSTDLDDWKVTFEGGMKEINEYLYSQIKPAETMICFEKEEKFLQLTEALLAENIANMESKNLPVEFTGIERERLRYEAFYPWTVYEFNHRWMATDETFVPGDIYFNKMSELIKENETLIGMGAYDRFVSKGIELITARNEQDPLKLTEARADYIVKNYKNETYRAKLLQEFIQTYVKAYGTKGSEKLMETYKQNVTNAEDLAAMDEIFNTWGKIAAGNPSPLFTYKDAQGVDVSLDSFKGNYVYIDLWASWCAPCRREIPALKELEHTFADKPIKFISISCDHQEDAWRTAMKEESLSGIQLFTNGDMSFMKAYMVDAIPRFILLDKEGCIISANMSMPSNPATAEELAKLLQ